MANPQKENGYTPIANEIMDRLVKMPLNGTQWRIVMFTCRFTYGYSRKEHEISESLIAKSIDVNKRQVQRELKELIDIRILTVIREATFNRTRLLSFNKDFDAWLMKERQVTKKTPDDKRDIQPGVQLDTQPDGKLDTHIKQKANIKTTRHKKENPNNNLIKYFTDEYKKKFSNAYVPNYGRDGKIIKDFLDGGYVEEYLQGYITWFLNSNDEYLNKTGYSIPLLKSRLDKYNVLQKRKEKEKSQDLTHRYD